MNERVQSISVQELSKAVGSAVEQAARRHEAFREVRHAGEIVLQPWIVGFILQDLHAFERATLSEARAFAGEVASNLSGVRGLAGGAGAAFVLDKGVVCGFFPEQSLPVLRE